MVVTSDAARVPTADRSLYRRAMAVLHDVMPTGLFARALIIIIMPVVTLQALIVFVFTERHWYEVTTQLTQTLVGDVAAVVDMIEMYPHAPDYSDVIALAQQRMGLNIAVLDHQALPSPGAPPSVEALYTLISKAINRQIGKPFYSTPPGDHS